MLDEYQVKNLIDSLGMNTVSFNELLKYNILNQCILNANEDQKQRITESFVEGICMQFRKGGQITDQAVVDHLIKSDLIQSNLLKLSDLIKDDVEIKIEKIFKELETNRNYDDLFFHLKEQIKPFIKKYTQTALAGKNSVIDESLRIVTIAFAKLSLKDHAEKLFLKAQGIINEEIIKEIIE
jgi:hypothetical protein